MSNDYADRPASARTGTEDADLELFKTGLRVQNGELLRVNKNGGIAMRLPLSSIESVEFLSQFDPFCLVFICVGLGLGAVGYLVSESNLLTSFLYAGSIMLVGFGSLGMVMRVIRVQSPTGIIRIQCNDLIDEGEGFVCSLQQLIGKGARGREGPAT
ncbi:MAG: hypothetical protein FJ271_26230 [Planctomycetes bacterium]|nr:hypothetical protein [Planctomycetota bacterium]